MMNDRLASVDPLGLLRTSEAVQNPAPSGLSALLRSLELIDQEVTGHMDCSPQSSCHPLSCPKVKCSLGCHPLNITSVEIDLTPVENPARVEIEARVRVSGKTGVEMEAMTAVSVAGLTIYDMCKAVDREMSIGEIRLVKKSGGKSGTFIRKE